MSVTVTTTQQLKQGTAKFWIVLVGVNRYLDSNILNLRYCANDCKELAEALKIATGKFQHTEIISLHDGGNLLPERSQIINSIQQFRFAKPEDTVLFYFSGHGYLDTNNRPVLCVADTKLDNLAETGLKLDFLLDELSQCRAQRQLVWLDACQSREQQSDKQIKNPTQQLSAALKEQADKSPNFYGMLSCNKQERSWEIEELQHGLFTFCLIEGLRGKAANSKGQIDADGLFDYIERISKRIIKDKKRSMDGEDLSKALDLSGLSATKPKRQISQLPANASQTPQRIIQGGGKLVFLIGLAAPINNRQALIIDRLSNSEATIGLCKLLQAQGNFAVEYRYLRDKQQWQLQQDIVRYLAADNRTVLLYLSGTIESTADRGYELVGDGKHRINLSWLAKELKASPVKEIVVIANITKATENTPNLESILQLNYDLPLCLIEATSRSGDRQFLTRLVTTLESAAQAEREFWVTDLISPLQKWSLEQPDIKVTGWWGTVGLIEILSVEVQRSDDRVFDIEVCPYKSLEAFTQDDAYFFHGREELVDKIIEKLKSNSFLAVVGASGSGKSSVVRAGVIPKLVTHGLNTSQSQHQDCQTWVMLPGDNPFIALAKAIAPNEPQLIEGILHAGIKGFVDWLRQQPQALSVLVIDQFEELFTIADEKETERDDFIDLIVGAIKQARDIFKVIITLRGDFINECLNLSEIAPLMEQNEILVPVKSSRLEDEQYRQIIAQPAQKVGLEVEDGLMAVLLEELKDGSLPLLQYALEELWQKRSQGKLSLKDYQQHIGRLGQFLSDKAEATYQNLNQLQQECAQSIFLSLVYLAQEQDKTNKDTRRRLLKSDLRVSKYKNTLDDTLQTLVNARLIVVSEENNNTSLVTDGDRTNALAVADEAKENIGDRDKDTIEIAHEILIDNWKTLKWWIDKNRDKYRLFKEIDRKAKDWKQNNQQEGFLLPKGALAKYEEFYIKYANELSPLSDRFMDASIQARNKADKLAKRRQRQIIGGLTGGIVAISMVAGAALWQLRQATISEINALVSSAETISKSEEELESLLPGLRAIKRAKNSFFSIGHKTELKTVGRLLNVFDKVQEFNYIGDGIRVVEFSLNKEIIASSADEKINLWNTKGKLINTLKGHTEPVDKIVFSPDKRTIVSSANKTVVVWNLNGKLICSFDSKTEFNNIVISPDGQTIALERDEGFELFSIQGKPINSIEFKFRNALLKQIEKKTPEKYLKIKLFFGFLFKTRFTPDGKAIIYSDKNNIRLWTIESDVIRTLEGHTSFIQNVVFSPDGKKFVSAANNELKLWDSQKKSAISLDGHTSFIQGVIFSPNGKKLVSAASNELKLWDLQKKSAISLNGHTSFIQSVMFSPDGKKLVSATSEEIKIWNSDGLLEKTLALEDKTSKILNVKLIVINNQLLIVANSENKTKSWTSEGELINTFDEGKIDKLMYDSKRRNVVVFANGKIRLGTIEKSLNMTFKVTEHKDKYSQQEYKSSNSKKNAFGSLIDILLHGAVVFSISPNGKMMVSTNGLEKAKLWNLNEKSFHWLKGHKDRINNVVFNPNGSMIATASEDETAKLWNTNGELLHTLEGHNDDVNDLAFSPDGNIIATVSEDKTVKLWNTNGELLHTLEGHNDDVNDLAFSPDGNIIATVSEDKTVKLWNTNGELLHTLEGHNDDVNDLAFSPDGNIIATASEDKTVKLWNTNGELLHTLEGHNDDVNDLAFSPDGNIIATASEDKTVKLWNTNGELLHTLEGHIYGVNDVRFNTKRSILATASEDETVKLWNYKGELIHTLNSNTKQIHELEFHPDGKTIVLGSRDGKVKFWSLDLDKLMARGCDWVRDYLENNPNVSEEDRKICDGY